MKATAEREAAIKASMTNFHEALALSRKVSDAWYRCQALAWTARFAPDEKVVKTASESLAAARESTDPYRIVAVAAWPLRALLERGHGAIAGKFLPELVELSAKIEHPVSRIEALFLLWQAFLPFSEGAEKRIFGVLVAECRKTNSWKAGRTLRDVALMVASKDSHEAERLTASMPEGKYRRQTSKWLAANHKAQARPFFWDGR